MAGILHGSARTTPRVRAELQASKEKTSILAIPSEPHDGCEVAGESNHIGCPDGST